MNKNYDLRTLEPGVYAAIASEQGSAGSNSGIIDLGNETIVFDTSSTLSAATELLEISRELTGRTPKYVVNSHSHPDHVQGNAVFSNHATLISSFVTRREIEQYGVTEMHNMKLDITSQLEQFQIQIGMGETPESERAELLSYICAFQSILDGYPTEQDLRLPELTFEKSLCLHGTSRSAQVLTLGGAHSKCDSVLWLPREGILFVGDLVIPEGHLILCLGIPERWPTVLRQLKDLDANTLITGHGDVVSSSEGYSASLDYLEMMFQLAKEAVNLELGPQYADAIEVPRGRSEYWFRKDLAFLIQRLMLGGIEY